MSLQVVSFGGGTQSTALMVLAAQGKIPHRTFLFANVGDDSEYAGTLEYVQRIAKPFAESQGLELVELRRERRDKTPETLYGRLTKEGSRSIGIPVRMSNGAPGTRQCTADFKIRVVGKWLKAHGASETNQAEVAIGFSTDEVNRISAAFDAREPYQFKSYPLIDLRLSRQDCSNLIQRHGLPLPPKSACWFCPYHSVAEWTRQAKDEPELFAKSCALEQKLIERRAEIGKDAVYFTRFGKPLAEVIHNRLAQGSLDLEDESCDSGFCFR